jgi:site-specific recombinase XerC
MFTRCTWQIDQSMILTRRELSAVLSTLARRAQKSVNAQQTLTIMRLACCCGLRVSEIATLRLDDVRVGIERPYLRIRREIAKCGRARNVPLWWDAGTLADIENWKAEREAHDAEGEQRLICSLLSQRRGMALSRHALRLRFQRACAVLGNERSQQVTIHHGRHTFISHALAGGRTLTEVRDAAGHASLAVTSIYSHIAVDDDGRVGNLFAFDGDERGNSGRATIPHL